MRPELIVITGEGAELEADGVGEWLELLKLHQHLKFK
jgi:hypothetical protein